MKISEKNLNISFEELAIRGKKILEEQKPISYIQALEQVKRLKHSSKVKKELKKIK